ncbi:MAG: hypothetical protein ACR2QL_01870 [Woeseiaceae bacterium]
MSIFINQVELIMQKITTSIPHRYSVCVFLMIAAVVVVPVNPAVAQDWRFSPEIAVGGEYDDNATLDIRTDEEVELEGYLFDLSAVIAYSSPKSEFSIQPIWRSRNYPDEPDFDSDDVFLNSRYTYIGNANTFGFRANFNSQSIRTAERSDSDLDVEDPDEIPENDSGRTFRNGTRDILRFSPFWRYQVSDTSSFGATVRYVDASYKDQVVQVLNDYTDARLNLDYRHGVSAVTTLVYGGTVRDYNSENSDAAIDGYGIFGGFDRAMSSTIQLEARIGVEKTNLSDVESDPEVVGSIRLSRNIETINLYAEYRRFIQASGTTSLAIRDQISVNFRRRLSEKISAGLGARAYKSRGFGDGSSIDDRNYVQLHASVRWYLVPTFTIETDYRYTVLDRLGAISEGSNANRVNLWFTWRPNTAR